MPATPDGDEAESKTQDESCAGDEAEGKLQQCSAHNDRGASESSDRVKIRAQHRGNFANEDVPCHAATNASKRAKQDRGDGRRAVLASLQRAGNRKERESGAIED